MAQIKTDVEVFKDVPIPAPVVSAVTKLIKRVRKQKDPKMVHYTPTYLSNCMRQQYYVLMNFPKEVLETDDEFSSGWNLFRGDCLHRGLARVYYWNELPLKIQYKISKNKSVIISGRLDCYQQDEAEILDLKSTKYVAYQKKSNFLPRAKDVNQLRIYRELYRDLLPVKKLTILYADMAELTAYDVPILPSTATWLKDRITQIEDAIETKIPPAANGKTDNPFLCNYCSFQTRCSKDPNGITGIPKSHPEELK